MTAGILVTGSHRSGTTWVGRLLSLPRDVAHIHEPLNPANRLRWCSVPPRHWYQHIDRHNAAEFEVAFARVLALRPPLRQHLSTVRTPRNLAANGRELVQVLRWRARRARPLVKDPLAFFASEWLAATFDVRVIVTVRHPAAFAGSLKRNGWTFDFHNFLHQPTLMAGDLAPFADDIERAAARPPDVVEQAILLWRCINATAARYRDEHPTWHVVRYEDLAADPVQGASSLYAAAGLDWNDEVVRGVEALSSSTNPAEVPVRRTRDVRRNSGEAMWTWRERLTPEELARVRDGTSDVAAGWYADADWERARRPTS